MTAAEVLRFWFSEIKAGWTADDRFILWFGGREEDDGVMREKFGDAMRAAIRGELDDWRRSPEELTALILLLDQMTRAIGRGTAAAFEGDGAAQTNCKTGLARGVDQLLPAVYRIFFYLPLEHSENLSDQEHCVFLFKKLRDDFPQFAKTLDHSLQYAVKHRDLIAQFGRFPHRNALLGRPSTDDEIAHLQSTNERFGQKSEK